MKKYDKKVHSVIPKPNSKTMAERIGLDEVNLKISLSDDAKNMVEDLRTTVQSETQKTRLVLIVLGIANAFSFLIGKYAF
jgi:hypothetical protein